MKERDLEEVTVILIDIFPTFEQQLKEDYEDEDETLDTLHRLFSDFIYYYGKHIEDFNTKQFQKFANFVNESVEIDDNLENAISTCFLEHLRQIKAIKPLKALLSKKAKSEI